MLTQKEIGLVRDQIRQLVDPMFLRIRTELYGSVHSGEFRDSLIPSTTIQEAVNSGVQETLHGNAVLSPYVLYKAGPEGVQTGKIVYTDNAGVVRHASANNVDHATKVVGLSIEPAGPSAQVKAQFCSHVELGMFSFTPGSLLFVGNNGDVVSTLPSDAKFVQAVGIALSTNKILVFITPEVYIV